MAASTPALAITTLLLAVLSSEFPSKSAADSSPECLYPCLPPPPPPPPTSAANCPPPPSPPSQPSLPYPSPPPPQPYTPVYYPPPSPPGTGYVPYFPPPSFAFPAPPPPNPVLPYFPWYYKSSSATSVPLLNYCLGLPMALLHLVLLYLFLR